MDVRKHCRHLDSWARFYNKGIVFWLQWGHNACLLMMLRFMNNTRFFHFSVKWTIKINLKNNENNRFMTLDPTVHLCDLYGPFISILMSSVSEKTQQTCWLSSYPAELPFLAAWWRVGGSLFCSVWIWEFLSRKGRRGVALLSLPTSCWTQHHKNMSASKVGSPTEKPGLEYPLSKWTEEELFQVFKREMCFSFSAASEEEQREIYQAALLRQPVIKLHRIGL